MRREEKHHKVAGRTFFETLTPEPGQGEMKVTKRIGLKVSSILAASLLALCSMSPAKLLAQAAANIHGHVQNPIGQPIPQVDVKLTTDRSSDPKTRKYAYTFQTDQSGDYKGTGITPGNYAVLVFQGDKTLDFQESVTFAAGDDKQVDFDMSRKEYLDKMTPEEKKQLEDFKKKNAEAVAGNAKIANLNAALTQARTDIKAGNFDAATTSMQQATTQKPDEPLLWMELGNAQLGAADAAAKGSGGTAGAASKYSDAIASYKKASDLNAAAKKPNPAVIGATYSQLGMAYLKAGDTKSSADAFDQAAKAMPTQAGMYYFNEAATLYNAQKLDEAAAAADKAIAADPNRADAYYIKGQSLVGKATFDEKTKKLSAPPGCLEAYQKYLQIAPDGPHAADVQGVLQGFGQTIQTNFKAGKK